MSVPRRVFEILGVSPSDDMTTIRMAWRAKVRRLHPDRARNGAWATSKLAEVNAAFDALQGHRPERPAAKAQPEKSTAPQKRGAPKKPRPRARPAPKSKPAKRDVTGRVPVASTQSDDWSLREKAARGYERARSIIAAA